jgi:hypothetical protein
VGAHDGKEKAACARARHTLRMLQRRLALAWDNRTTPNSKNRAVISPSQGPPCPALRSYLEARTVKTHAACNAFSSRVRTSGRAVFSAVVIRVFSVAGSKADTSAPKS